MVFCEIMILIISNNNNNNNDNNNNNNNKLKFQRVANYMSGLLSHSADLQGCCSAASPLRTGTAPGASGSGSHP